MEKPKLVDSIKNEGTGSRVKSLIPIINCNNRSVKMKCSNCESIIDKDAIFCFNCGSKISKLEEKSDATSSSPNNSGFGNPDEYSGTRGKSQEKVRTKFFYGKARYAHEVDKIVNRFLISRDLKTQIIEANNEIIIQGKKKPNVLNKALGLDQAVTVGISVEGDDIKVTVGGAKWIDKAVGATIGMFIFAPVLLTAGWGTYKQRQLFSEIEKEVEKFLSSRM